MQLIVTGRHVSVTGAMKQYAREKLGRIMTARPHLNEAHMIMDVQKYRHLVEITVRGKDLELFCREETPDMYASIDSAMAKLERQLRRFKERHTKKQKTLRQPSREALRRRTGEAKPGEVGITLRFPMNPMFLNEALLQMKVQQHLFFVFLNADTERVNLLCRPGEGEVGHLLPKKLQGPGRPAVFQMRVYREESVTPDRKPRTSRKEDCTVEWATPEEAVEAMADTGEKYRFFMNTETRNPCIVSAQASGAYGLIEPRP
jgi:putative sigma-54 modulation protein